MSSTAKTSPSPSPTPTPDPASTAKATVDEGAPGLEPAAETGDPSQMDVDPLDVHSLESDLEENVATDPGTASGTGSKETKSNLTAGSSAAQVGTQRRNLSVKECEVIVAKLQRTRALSEECVPSAYDLYHEYVPRNARLPNLPLYLLPEMVPAGMQFHPDALQATFGTQIGGPLLMRCDRGSTAGNIKPADRYSTRVWREINRISNGIFVPTPDPCSTCRQEGSDACSFDARRGRGDACTRCKALKRRCSRVQARELEQVRAVGRMEGYIACASGATVQWIQQQGDIATQPSQP